MSRAGDRANIQQAATGGPDFTIKEWPERTPEAPKRTLDAPSEAAHREHVHDQRFDGDDPYLICHGCGKRWDALTGLPTEPWTEAGKALLERESLNSRSFALITPEAIRRVEAEAAMHDSYCNHAAVCETESFDDGLRTGLASGLIANFPEEVKAAVRLVGEESGTFLDGDQADAFTDRVLDAMAGAR